MSESNRSASGIPESADSPSYGQGSNEGSAYYDVVILGGGAAGCAAALSLRQESPGLSIAVLERTTYSEFRPGELLSASAQSLLEQLHIWESFLAIGYPRANVVSSTWGTGELVGQGELRDSFRPGWRLERRCFDRFLADEACHRGAHIYTGVLLQHARIEDGVWHLEIRRTQTVSELLGLRAGFVIDASGREATFATRRGVRSVPLDRLVGAFAFFSFGQNDAESGGEMKGPLIESCEHGWWYSSPISSSEMVVACFTDADIAGQLHLTESMSWTTLLGETYYTCDRVRSAESQTHPEIVPAHSHRLERMRGERWLAAGDAAASCDPLVSQGINRALCSGLLAAGAVDDFYRGKRAGLEKYEGLMIAEYEDHLKARSELYRRELQWKHTLFWTRRQVDVTLHPERVVRLQQQTPNLYQFAGVYLSLRELKMLCDICSRPSPAHEVVAAFRAQRKSVAADVTVMAALQHLIDAGVLTCAA